MSRRRLAAKAAGAAALYDLYLDATAIFAPACWSADDPCRFQKRESFSSDYGDRFSETIF